MPDLSKYFTDSELACKGSGVVLLDPRFADNLFVYREAVDMPLNPDSCCRSTAHNTSIGGAKSSYHLYEGINDGRLGTLAIDLRVPNDKQRVIMVAKALKLDWSVGVYKTFIHIDRRVDVGKPQVLFWGKY